MCVSGLPCRLPLKVARVFKLIAEDESFGRTLDAALAQKAEWLRDMGGVAFRLHGLAAQGELRGVDPKATARLGAIVEHIFAPFERTPVPRLDGHYIGALYMQAVVPWLCAWRAGAKTDALAATVRRAGRAVCHWLKHAPGNKAELRRRVCERLHPDYVTLCSSPVWGGQDKDVVWRAFLA